MASLLHAINTTNQQQPQQLNSQPSAGHDPSNPLAALLAQFTNKAPAQPVQMAPQPPTFNLQAALAGMAQPQQPGYQNQAAYGVQPGAQPANPYLNVQTILSQLSNQGSTPQAPPMQGYGAMADPASYSMNEDRKRHLENEEGDYGRKKPRGGKPFTGTPHLPCRFWQEGKCRKGEECTFLHDM